MTVTGPFDNSGCPTIAIEVSGPFTPKKKFNALVDTGFSGFLLMPILEAFPLGLILRGTMSVELADGSSQTKLTCLGEIRLDGQTQIGLVLIEW